MILAHYMRECPDRLDADLMRVYGFSVHAIRERSLPLSTIAACAAYLPRGSAVHRWFGDWQAVSEEAHLLSHLIWQHQAVNSKKKPEYVRPPVGEREVQMRGALKHAKQADRMRALRLMRQAMRGENDE